MMFYALATRALVEEDGGGHWGLPPGTIGAVDLARASGKGPVFVTSDKPFAAADLEVAIGDGTGLGSYVPTPDERRAWEQLVGVAIEPGWTLLEALWFTLTTHADPDGTARCRPLMPTHKGVIELHLGGHGLVRAETLTGDPATHPAWPNIERVLQGVYRAVQDRDPALARKWLGAQSAKYRLSPERARDLLIPADLPRVLPDRPTTTITDDFNRPDQSGLGTSAEGWSWTTTAPAIDIVSNHAESQGGSEESARAEVDLSSDDHYAQASVTIGAVDQAVGVIVRFENAAGGDYYWGRTNSAASRWDLWKKVGGSFTLLGTNTTGWARPAGATLKVEADGTTIRVLQDGVEKISVSDASVAGHLRTGIAGWDAEKIWDDFEAADLLAGTELVRVRSDEAGIGEASSRARGLTRSHDDAVAVGHLVQRLRALARRRAELVGMAGAIARIGGLVNATPALTGRIRMRIGAALRLSVKPSTRMNVPPARR